jgi:hypothetical protein
MKKKYFSVRNLFAASAVVLSGLLFAGCNKDDDTNIPDQPVAGLMAANLATDKASIGVRLSGNALGSAPLAYSNFTGGYLPIFPGDRPVTAFDFNSGTEITSDSYNFEVDKYYSLFVIGANNNYRNVIVNDDFESLSSNGSAYIRYINAIPDSSGTNNVTISAGGSDVVNQTAPYASISNFVEVAPGSVTIDMSNGGSIDASRTITLEARKVYTVLLIGDPNSLTTEVEIRFIENGTLDEEPAGRTSASSQSTGSK